MGLKEGKVAVKLRFRWLSLTEYIITICRCVNWRIRIRVDGKQIYKKSGFKFLRPLVSVFSRTYRSHTPKIFKVAFKVRHIHYYEHFLSLFFRKVPSNHRRCLEWKLSRYIKGLYLRLSNNEFLDPVFQQHRNFIQTPYAWTKVVPWKRVILQCRI